MLPLGALSGILLEPSWDGGLLGRLEAILGVLERPSALSEPSWTVLGASVGRLGALLGRLGALLGASWAFLGPLWRLLGPSWASESRERRER